jgi:transcriptional regulator with XRE-family HTH domain
MVVKDDATHRLTPRVLSLVGIRARKRREELGLTLREVALDAGLSLPYIANLEKARGNPTLDTLVRLSEALDVPLAEMLR